MSWPATRTLTFAVIEATVRAHLAASRRRAFAPQRFDDWPGVALHLAESPPARGEGATPPPAGTGAGSGGPLSRFFRTGTR